MDPHKIKFSKVVNSWYYKNIEMNLKNKKENIS